MDKRNSISPPLSRDKWKSLLNNDIIYRNKLFTEITWSISEGNLITLALGRVTLGRPLLLVREFRTLDVHRAYVKSGQYR